MMSKIQFESTESRLTILEPSKEFAEGLHTVVIRKDPLLGDTSVYNPFLKDKARLFFGENDAELLRHLIESSGSTCFFCGEGVAKNTPKYPPALVADGRLQVGEAILFPNLFSIAKYHAITALSRAHFLALSEFTPQLLFGGLSVNQEFLKAVYRDDQTILFAIVCANYLFPAGASLVHPHMQTLVSPVSHSYHNRLMAACKDYYQKEDSIYHEDLIAVEKDIGTRYIAQMGRWHWIAAFSPIGSNEVMAIHEHESDFAELTMEDIGALSYGISRVLHCYGSLGYLSFNYALYSSKKLAREEGQRSIIKIITRQNLYPNYRNDDYFLQKLLQSELIITLPEELTLKMRRFFSPECT
jgi:galactose-1-phosphate uridylyltransferase